jgi:hypothetical protein
MLLQTAQNSMAQNLATYNEGTGYAQSEHFYLNVILRERFVGSHPEGA